MRNRANLDSLPAKRHSCARNLQSYRISRANKPREVHIGRTQLYSDQLLRSFAVFIKAIVELVRSPVQSLAAVGVCPLCQVKVLLILNRVFFALLDL